MRLLYLTRRSWPALGGIEALVRHVAHGVAQHHDVSVIALRTDDGPISTVSDGPGLPKPFLRFVDGPVVISPLRLSQARTVALAPLLLQQLPLLRRYAFRYPRLPLAWHYARVVAPVLRPAVDKADVVHVWCDGFPAAAAVRAARQAGKPVIVTPFMHRGAWGDDSASVATYKRADRVVALLAPEASEYVALGVAPDRVVFSGACTPGVPYADGDELRRRYGIEGALVLFLGNRVPHKGAHLLLDAALNMPPRPRMTFAFVGPGPAIPLDGAPEGIRVLDVGVVSDADRASWLHAADLLCLPSASETFGIVVLEAWSAGTPVLTSDAPQLRALVEDSNGGRWVRRDPDSIANALVELFADPDALARQGAQGHRYWQAHYTVDRVAAWHVNLYRELLK